VLVSVLASLKSMIAFGRPDFEDILGRLHEDVKRKIEDRLIRKVKK